MTAVSVTEVRNALRCPRIFALGRRLGGAVAFPVGASALGATFHRIAHAATRLAESPPPALARLPEGAAVSAVSDALASFLCGLLARELEANALYASMPAEVDELAEALREWAHHLAERIAAFGDPPGVCLARVLSQSELDVGHVFELPDQESIRVEGRVDAIYGTREGSLEVVEYKLTDEANAELDRAQVALYRRLLSDSSGVVADAVLLRFTPRLSETRVEPQVADELVNHRVLPLLREMLAWEAAPESAPPTPRSDLCAGCPFRSECARFYADHVPARDDPPAGALRPRPEPSGMLGKDPPAVAARVSERPLADVEGTLEAEELRRALTQILRRRALSADLRKAPLIGPRVISLELSVLRGKVTDIDRLAPDVEHLLLVQHGVQCSYRKQGGLRAFDVVRKSPRRVTLRTLLETAHGWLSGAPGRFVLGEAQDGSLVKGDLGDPACCHLLVAGMTGSGKSVLLRGIIASLTQFQPPSALQFTLIDPKRVSFGPLATALAAHLARPILFEAEEVLSVLEALCDEMEDRYQRFADESTQDLLEYNEAVPAAERLSRQVVVLDEFQDLANSKQTAAPFLELIQRLGTKARAAGIHLILATQRPDAKTVPGLIKANLPGRIALRVQSSINSRIILDQSGAEHLLGKGDLLADLGDGLVRAQAAI